VLLASTVTPLQAGPPGVLQQVGYYIRKGKEGKEKRKGKERLKEKERLRPLSPYLPLVRQDKAKPIVQVTRGPNKEEVSCHQLDAVVTMVINV
jgi:hypothetical protein